MGLAWPEEDAKDSAGNGRGYWDPHRPRGLRWIPASGLGACPLVSRPHDDCVACLDSGTDTNSSVDTEVLETFQMSLLRDTLSIENTTSRSLQAPLARAVETSALPLGLYVFMLFPPFSGGSRK